MFFAKKVLTKQILEVFYLCGMFAFDFKREVSGHSAN